MTLPQDWFHACKEIGETRHSRAEWLLKFFNESPKFFSQCEAPKQKSLRWELQAFLDEGTSADSSTLRVDERFAERLYSTVCGIFAKLRRKEAVYYQTEVRRVLSHTASLEESTRTLRVHKRETAQYLANMDASYWVCCTFDGILRRCTALDTHLISLRKTKFRNAILGLPRMARKNRPAGG